MFRGHGERGSGNGPAHGEEGADGEDGRREHVAHDQGTHERPELPAGTTGTKSED